MKKIFALLLSVGMIAAILSGCGAAVEPVSGLSDEQQAMLEEMGISQEELDQMSDEMRQALLDELGIVAGSRETKPQANKPSKSYTTSDVATGGKYRVRIGDGRWNNYYLYYEDGKLVKVEISFQKSSEEEPETYLFEGDTLQDFWYIDKSLDELIDYFDQQDYGYTHNITPMD